MAFGDQSKRRAFMTHFAFSALIAGLVCAAIFFVWYPAPYFKVKGAWSALRVLLGVHLALGPALTLILWKPNKPGLKLDMTVVAIVQLAALIYGSTVLFRERPYYLVFAVDRFEVVARTEIDRSALAEAEWLRKPWRRPVLVYAVRPEDSEAMQTLLSEVLFEGKADIERRPEFWRDYAEHAEEVSAKAMDLRDLTAADPGIAAAIAAIAESGDRRLDELGAVPLIGRERNFAAIVDLGDASPLGIVDVDAWSPAGRRTASAEPND